MATLLMPDSTQVCEDALRADKAYNVENAILPSENRIIDRLLTRRVELVRPMPIFTKSCTTGSMGSRRS